MAEARRSGGRTEALCVRDGVADSAHGGDLHFYHIARLEFPHTIRRTRENQVARLERHDSRDEAQNRGNVEHHAGRAATLAYGTVDTRGDRERREIGRSRPHRTDGAEGVKSLCTRPLSVGLLEITRRHVIRSNDAANGGARLIPARTPQWVRHDDADLPFILHLL